MSLSPSETVRYKIVAMYADSPEDEGRLSGLLDDLEDAIDKEYDLPNWKIRLICGSLMAVTVLPILAAISARFWIGSQHPRIFEMTFLVFTAIYSMVFIALEQPFHRFVGWVGRKFTK